MIMEFLSVVSNVGDLLGLAVRQRLYCSSCSKGKLNKARNV